MLHSDCVKGSFSARLTCTAANVNDVTPGNALLHGDETEAFGDAGYQGIAKREDAADIDWHVAMRPGKRRALDLDRKSNAIERIKARIRAKVEHRSG